VLELGDVVAGSTAVRRQETDITVCDLTGTGVQDTAIATLTLGKVKKSNAGTTLVS
jgi:ornithine cyclodeaminase